MLLLKISFGRPKFTRLDKALSEETKATNEMAEDAGNFNKVLLASSLFERWDKTVTSIRSKFYDLTSPWDDSGYRLILPDAYFKFQRTWAEEVPILDAFRKDFVNRYPYLRDEQKLRLGKAFSLKDFPPVEEIAKRFHFNTDVSQVPEKGKLATFLGEEQERRIIERTEERLEEAHRANVDRLLQALNHLVTVAKDEDKTAKAKSSTVGNLQKVAELIPDLNFRGDQTLTHAANQIRKMVEGLTMRDLKDSPELRRQVAQTGSALASQLSSPPVATAADTPPEEADFLCA